MNKAILFSTIWHLFWISVIGVVVTPAVQTGNVYQEVAFLGPILEKTAFDFMAEGAIPQAETLYAKSTFFLDKIYLRPKGPERKVPKGFVSGTALDKVKSSMRTFERSSKEIPRFIDDIVRIPYSKSRKKIESTSIEGPASEREVVSKPKRFTIPRGLYGNQEEYRVKLKFFLSTDGIVYNPKLLISSGYPEVDLRAIRFLKCWRFSPLSFIERDKSAAWGIVTVNAVSK